MPNPFKQRLIDTGLNAYEADVYLALAEHSPATAGFVAKKIGHSRSTVYTALSRLIAKGLVGTAYKNDVKQFIAQPASAIAALLQDERKRLDSRIKSFEGLAAELAFLAKENANVPDAVIFEGNDALRKIYLDMLRNAPKGATMRVIRDEFKWDKEWSFLLEEDWKEKIRRIRTEHRIGTRMLINDSKRERAQVPYYRARKQLDFRFLPKGVALQKFVLYVIGDTVAMLSLGKDGVIGIKMTNALLARNFTMLFDALWAIGKK